MEVVDEVEERALEGLLNDGVEDEDGEEEDEERPDYHVPTLCPREESSLESRRLSTQAQPLDARDLIASGG